MVEHTRILESALGSNEKFLAENETDSVVVQRRCIRAGKDLPNGHVITRNDLDILRPATPGAITPDQLQTVVGKELSVELKFGQELRWNYLR